MGDNGVGLNNTILLKNPLAFEFESEEAIFC
jgi:hypothetical protein